MTTASKTKGGLTAVKKRVVAHLKKDEAEFRSQLKDDKKLKKQLKKSR